jgi:predicted nucleic acid-binding protein
MPAQLRFGWDATVFIALLTNEVRSADDLAGLAEVVELADQRRARIVTSALIHSEAIGRPRNPHVVQALERLFKRPNFIQMDINPEISRMGGRIREQVLEDGLSLTTEDASYIATALAYKVDAFHTFDHHQLRLAGHRSVGSLVICKPRGSQTLLPLFEGGPTGT